MDCYRENHPDGQVVVTVYITPFELEQMAWTAWKKLRESKVGDDLTVKRIFSTTDNFQVNFVVAQGIRAMPKGCLEVTDEKEI